MRKYLYIILFSFLVSTNSFAGLFDKNKIKVSKCYDVKQKSLREYKKKYPGFKWEADINLKDDTVVITVIDNGKVSLFRTMINMKTDRFIGTYALEPVGTVHVFDMKKESVTQRNDNWDDTMAEIMGGRETILKCKFS